MAIKQRERQSPAQKKTIRATIHQFDEARFHYYQEGFCILTGEAVQSKERVQQVVRVEETQEDREVRQRTRRPGVDDVQTGVEDCGFPRGNRLALE